MKPPLIVRLLPERYRTSAYLRWYHPPAEVWHPLFADASLAYAPGVRMALVPGDVSHGCIAFTGLVERRLTRRISALARVGGLMVDVGANAGYYSLLWAAARPENQVIAFEASPRNQDLLAGNVRRNKLAERIDVRPEAVGAGQDTMFFELGPGDQTGWGGLALAAGPGAVEVPVVCLDDALPPGATVDVPKVDVEGADTWVLAGCRRLLGRKAIRHVFFEQNKPRLRALGLRESEAQEVLAACGYEAAPMSDPGGDLVDWHAKSG